VRQLRPFFSYFGSKWMLARYYPEPLHGVIVEPFAGSAGYALRHSDRNVQLIDLNPVIAGLWKYLISAKASEIRSLPLDVDSVEDVSGPEEARALIGFWLGRAQRAPSRQRTPWAKDGRWPLCFWGERVRDRIAVQVEQIRHWKAVEGSYKGSPPIEATWFVDPPYERQGRWYFGASALDYAEIGAWCASLSGQVIACENAGATWLPFEAFRTARANSSRGNGRTTKEVIWQRSVA
jgi:hypothetical protein